MCNINNKQEQRTICLFDKKIEIRKYGCSKNDNPIKYIKNPSVNLFIQVTNKCNANCRFCEFHSNCNIDNSNFDLQKLQIILEEIAKNSYHIGKINFTGGEPTLDLSLFHNVVSITQNTIKEKLSYKPEITLNTNGVHLLNMLQYEDFLNNIGLSRHHYDDERNEKIFQTKSVATNNTIKLFQENTKNKKLLQLRCNLIPNKIDNYEKIVKYLDKAIELGCCDCGFVTLMPLNEYCKDNQVDFEALIKDSPNIINVVSWKRYNDMIDNDNVELCKCSNYIYQNKNGIFCKFYRRHFCHNDLNAGQLVFDGKFLRFGFGGEIIY